MENRSAIASAEIIFDFCDQVRLSNRINMFGVGREIQRHFGTSRIVASDYAKAWMKTFDGTGKTTKERATEAFTGGLLPSQYEIG